METLIYIYLCLSTHVFRQSVWMNEAMNWIHWNYQATNMFYNPWRMHCTLRLNVSKTCRSICIMLNMAFYIELNKPLSRPRSMAPTDLLHALERKTNGTINREQQVKENHMTICNCIKLLYTGCSGAFPNYITCSLFGRGNPIPGGAVVSFGCWDST